MIEIKPPTKMTDEQYWSHPLVVFLAGSIEMGAAEEWQTRVAEGLVKYPVCILNPRRDDWDSSWVQSIDNAQFHEQVSWELEYLERCDEIFLYLAPGTQSPISLLEFGLYARSGKLVVCCPEGFWRKGNVDVVCQRYGVEQVDSIEDYISRVRADTRLL